MMKVFTTIVFPLILLLAPLGCDYGTLEGEGEGDATTEQWEEWEEWENYSDLEGDLTIASKKKTEAQDTDFIELLEDSEGLEELGLSYKPEKYNIEAIEVDPVEIELNPIADCKCDCTMHAVACVNAGCPAGSQPVDNAGTCVQNGDICGGNCNCHDCYTPVGQMCHSFPAAKAGICKWHF